jgi:hypothetical protein
MKFEPGFRERWAALETHLPKVDLIKNTRDGACESKRFLGIFSIFAGSAELNQQVLRRQYNYYVDDC